MYKYILLILLLFLIMKGNAKRKGSWFTPSGLLLIIYFISAACAIPTIVYEDYMRPREADFMPSLLMFVAMLLCFIVPFCRYNETEKQHIVLPSKDILNVFSIFIISISLFSIAYFSSSVSNIFQMSSLGDARSQLYAGEMYVETGLMNTIASVGASMYVFALLLFFVYYISGASRIRTTLLLISSVSEPLHVLSYVGRDGIVFWLFSFLFLFLLFRPYLDSSKQKQLLKSFSIGAGILLIPFMAISISRFGTSDTGTNASLITYMGQGFVNGPLFFDIPQKPFSHYGCFPLFYEITGIKQTVGYQMGGGMMVEGEWRSWAFGTFVSSFYLYMGALGMILLCMAMYLCFRLIMSSNKDMLYFDKLFVYLLYFQIYSQGVFYFRQSNRGGNLFIVICFLLWIVFAQLRKNGGAQIISK